MNRVLPARYLLPQQGTLEKKVDSVPEDNDRPVAKVNLISMVVDTGRLAMEQERCLAARADG